MIVVLLTVVIVHHGAIGSELVPLCGRILVVVINKIREDVAPPVSTADGGRRVLSSLLPQVFGGGLLVRDVVIEGGPVTTSTPGVERFGHHCGRRGGHHGPRHHPTVSSTSAARW